MKAKKSYGQHFLKNEGVSAAIANALTRTDDYQRVLEIGPGKGMLTKYLLKKEYDLLVVEADRDMVSYLQRNFPELREKIISADFLKVPLAEIFKKDQFAIIRNRNQDIAQ